MLPLVLAGLLSNSPTSAPVDESSPEAIAAAPRVYNAVRVREKMRVDGKAREEVWKRAPRDSRFIQRSPELAGEPKVQTSVQIAYDDTALYVFVEAEMDPKDILARNLRRDAFEIFSDDAVTLKIDPRHDRRTSVSFGTNTEGAQIDMMTLEDGRVNMLAWDAVWEVEAVVHEKGYSAEYRIPFAALGIPNREEITMGFNLSRDHQVANATYDWKLILPPRRPTSASSFGEIHGLKNIRSGRALELIPFVAASTDFEKRFAIDPRRAPNLSFGSDLRLQVAAGTYVEASVMTDFAQVEADEIKVAQDRFPLFFPERRPFFITGLDIFNFGIPRKAQLFFSRRVGLDDGEPVPIGAGAKAYGRTKTLSYGILNVQSLSSDVEEEDIEVTPENAEQVVNERRRPTFNRHPENFSVARLRFHPNRQWTMGVIGLGKHRFGETDHDAISAGMDAELRALENKYRWYAAVAASRYQLPSDWLDDDELIDATIEDSSRTTANNRYKPGQSLGGTSALTTMSYQGLKWRPNAYWTWSDDSFEAPLGFYQRPGTGQQGAEISYAPRPELLGLRDLEIGPRYDSTASSDYGEWLTNSVGGEFKANWKNSFQVYYWGRYVDDVVSDSFELYQYDIDSNRYKGTRQGFGFRSPRRNMINVSGSYSNSKVFNGVTHEFHGRINAKLSKHLNIVGDYRHRLGHLENPDDAFNFGFANAKVNVAFTRDLSWTTALRMSREPGNESAAVQSRLRWRYQPGADIFLVYSTYQPTGETPLDPDTGRVPFHAITLKATYYFQALLGRS